MQELDSSGDGANPQIVLALLDDIEAFERAGFAAEWAAWSDDPMRYEDAMEQWNLRLNAEKPAS